MKELIIAKRYANAAVLNIKEENYSAMIEEAKRLSKIFDEDEKVYSFFKSKVVSTNAKLDFLNQLLPDSEFKDFWDSFFLLLSSKNRLMIFSLVLKEIVKQLYAKSDTEEFDIIMAFRHDQDTLENVVNNIESTIGRKISYNLIVDSSIIGGFIAKSENQIIDASISGNLVRFKKLNNPL